MYNLFNKFPIIAYNGQAAINLISKVAFNNAARKAAAVYYPYTIIEGERPDVIAANYYEDARYSWLIYMVNDIVDPHHDWPMTEEQFRSFIIKKYGSIDKASESIAFWRVNWYEDETMLTPAGYAALPSYAKKYFAPYGNSTQILGYKRSVLDLATETNKILEVKVDSTTGFEVGEQLIQKTSGTITCTSFVSMVKDSTTLVVNDVLGLFETTDGVTYSDLVGQTSGTSAAVTNAQLLVQPIPANETQYWSYVTNLDYETELNEQKRHIRLLDKAYVDQVERELDAVL